MGGSLVYLFLMRVFLAAWFWCGTGGLRVLLGGFSRGAPLPPPYRGGFSAARNHFKYEFVSGVFCDGWAPVYHRSVGGFGVGLKKSVCSFVLGFACGLRRTRLFYRTSFSRAQGLRLRLSPLTTSLVWREGGRGTGVLSQGR